MQPHCRIHPRHSARPRRLQVQCTAIELPQQSKPQPDAGKNKLPARGPPVKPHLEATLTTIVTLPAKSAVRSTLPRMSTAAGSKDGAGAGEWAAGGVRQRPGSQQQRHDAAAPRSSEQRSSAPSRLSSVHAGPLMPPPQSSSNVPAHQASRNCVLTRQPRRIEAGPLPPRLRLLLRDVGRHVGRRVRVMPLLLKRL